MVFKHAPSRVVEKTDMYFLLRVKAAAMWSLESVGNRPTAGIRADKIRPTFRSLVS
jgi:hypothetical protein